MITIAAYRGTCSPYESPSFKGEAICDNEIAASSATPRNGVYDCHPGSLEFIL